MVSRPKFGGEQFYYHFLDARVCSTKQIKYGVIYFRKPGYREVFIYILIYVKVKVNRYKPDVALGVPGG
jgi:hypothetical protein